MAESFTRTSYDYPLPIKQVRHYLITAKTSTEKAVWRNMLNGPEYNKFKDGVRLANRKNRREDVDDAPKAKKKR